MSDSKIILPFGVGDPKIITPGVPEKPDFETVTLKFKKMHYVSPAPLVAKGKGARLVLQQKAFRIEPLVKLEPGKRYHLVIVELPDAPKPETAA